MNKIIFSLVMLAMLIPQSYAADATGVNLKPKTKQEWQTYLRYRRDQALEDLYALKPEAKYVVNHAYGYGVFSNFGLKIGFIGGNSGRGLVHDNRSGKEVFMRMAEGGVGLGLGIKDYRMIFVFDDRSVMDTFMRGSWSFGGGADAAVKTETAGASTAGAIDLSPGVHMYALTKNGLSVQAMVNGAKYWVDGHVN